MALFKKRNPDVITIPTKDGKGGIDYFKDDYTEEGWRQIQSLEKRSRNMPRGRKKRDTAPSGVPIILISDGGGNKPAKPKAPRAATRKGKPVRAKVGGKSVTFYPKEFGIQVAASMAEAGVALASASLDMAAAYTDTTVDDQVLRYAKPVAGHTLRWLGGRMAKKHPGMAYVMTSAGSALNGDFWGQTFRKAGIKAIDSAAKKQGAST